MFVGAPARHRWTMSAVANDTHARGSKALRRTLLGLQGFTLVGVVAGVHGFVTGAFEPLVAELVGHLAVVDDAGRVPALALGLVVGVPQLVALVLALRADRRAAVVGLAAGMTLTAWVVVQLPLIGWSSPIQWAFFAVGLCESAVAWRLARPSVSRDDAVAEQRTAR